MPRIVVGPNEAFTGAGILRCQRGGLHDAAEKPFVSVQVGECAVDAILDTGGVWFILSPGEATLAGIEGWEPLTEETLGIHGHRIGGQTYRAPVVLLAQEGFAVEVDMNIFVPEVDEDDWDLPSFLGWQGCLNLFRFALDATAERFYFATLG